MRVNVDDTTLGTTPDAYADFTLTIIGLVFAPAVNFGGGASRFDVAIADINGDKNPDLVTANHVSQHVSVLLGDGNGGYGTPANFSAGTIPTGVAVGDFDDDKIPDIAVANFSSSNVSILRGDGIGGFSAPQTSPSPAVRCRWSLRI